MIMLDAKDIGGGIVRRAFTAGNHQHRVGENLTAEQVTAWPTANRRALINNGFIEVYPVAPASSVADKTQYAAPAQTRKRRAS